MRNGWARLVASGVLVACLLGTVAETAGADTLLRRERMLGWVNHARHEAGVRSLDLGWRLTSIARDHSRAMAKQDRLFHSTSLSAKLSFANWNTWGENVGAGMDAWGLYRAFMKSPDHRRNMLEGRFRRVGIGFVRDDADRILWVTMVFYG
jgi:uncharacterized protein YkwD